MDHEWADQSADAAPHHQAEPTWPVDPSADPATAPIELVPLDEASPRRRSRRILAMSGAGLLVAATIGGMLVLRGGKAEGYRILEAQAATGAAESIRMEAEVVSGALPAPMKISGVFDTASKRAEMSFDVSAMMPGASGQMTMKLDHLVMYMKFPTIPDAPAELTDKWIEFDLTKAAEESGMDLSSLQSNNPSSALELLDQMGNPTELGFEDVGGVKTKHYSVTLEVRDVLAKQGAIKDATKLDKVLELVGEEMPMDVWVDEDNRVRQMKYSLDFSQAGGDTGLGAAGKMDFTMRFTEFGGPVDIAIPGDDETMSLEELMTLGS